MSSVQTQCYRPPWANRPSNEVRRILSNGFETMNTYPFNFIVQQMEITHLCIPQAIKYFYQCRVNISGDYNLFVARFSLKTHFESINMEINPALIEILHSSNTNDPPCVDSILTLEALSHKTFVDVYSIAHKVNKREASRSFLSTLPAFKSQSMSQNSILYGINNINNETLQIFDQINGSDGLFWNLNYKFAIAVDGSFMYMITSTIPDPNRLFNKMFVSNLIDQYDPCNRHFWIFLSDFIRFTKKQKIDFEFGILNCGESVLIPKDCICLMVAIELGKTSSAIIEYLSCENSVSVSSVTNDGSLSFLSDKKLWWQQCDFDGVPKVCLYIIYNTAQCLYIYPFIIYIETYSI